MGSEVNVTQLRIEAADRYLRKPHVRLTKWLQSQGFETIPQRTRSHQEVIESIPVEQHAEASEWIRDTASELESWSLKGLSYDVANEIAHRLVDRHLALVPVAAEQQRKIAGDGLTVEPIVGMDYLPDYMRWALNHPGLNFNRDEIRDESVREKCERFELINPCPNQAAKNAFERYRGDDKAIDNLLRECTKMYNDDRKNSSEASSTADGRVSPEERLKNREFTASLRKQLGMA